jgi:hypothetical protein
MLPPGVSDWEWGATCLNPNSNLALRRSFTIPARDTLTARLWISAHGGGLAYVNGHQVAQSIGDPALVDVTSLLYGNGAKNVLAIAAAQGANGGGIGYRLQITISKHAEAAFLRTHPSYRMLPQPPLLGPGAPAQVTASTGQTVSQGSPGTCTSNLASSVLAVSTDQTTRPQPVSTGWIYQSTVFYQPNVRYPYLSTRNLDLSAIATAADMPDLAVGGQRVQTVAIAGDDQTGTQVLVLPSFTASNVQPVTVSLLQAHNQPVGQSVQVTTYSRAGSCIVAESPTVVAYRTNAMGNQIAQLDTILYNDGSDGGVAQDRNGILLGEIAFDPAITSPQGQPVALIQPITTLQPALDALIAVLARQQQPSSTQHAIIVNADGSLSRLNGSGATAGPTTPAPATTAGATGSPTPAATATATP